MIISIRQPTGAGTPQKRGKSKTRVKEPINESEMGFCHHCKQFKTTYIMADCKYKSHIHGLMLPINYAINGISCPNVEPHNTEILNHIILRKVY